MPTLIRITSDSTRAELEEAIGHLRDKQQRVTLATTKAEIQVSIDALLDSWGKAPD